MKEEVPKDEIKNNDVSEEINGVGVTDKSDNKDIDKEIIHVDEVEEKKYLDSFKRENEFELETKESSIVSRENDIKELEAEFDSPMGRNKRKSEPVKAENMFESDTKTNAINRNEVNIEIVKTKLKSLNSFRRKEFKQVEPVITKPDNNTLKEISKQQEPIIEAQNNNDYKVPLITVPVEVHPVPEG